MIRAITSILFGLFLSQGLQAQHFFKFKIPVEKTYDDKVSFKCDSGYFTKNENGNYFITMGKIHKEKTIYVLKSNQIIDSFQSNNLYNSVHFVADGHRFIQENRAIKATWESMKILKNIRIEIMDEDKLVETAEITRLTLVVSRKEWVGTRTLSFKKEDETEIELSNFGNQKELLPGDLVIVTGINIQLENGSNMKIIGYTIHIASEEDLLEEEATKEYSKVERTFKIYDSHLKEGYFLKGKVLENNHAQFDELNLGTSPNAVAIAKVIKSANIEAMVGPWEIYLPTGQLFAKGTISYDPKLSVYKLDNNWVQLVEKEILKE